MLELLIAVLMWACATSGVLLRYAPFAVICDAKQKRTLFLIYGGAGVVYIAVVTVILHVWGFSILVPCLQVGGTILAVALSLANILVIPGKRKEHLFALGFVLTCHYLLMSIPAYVVSLLELTGAAELLVFIILYCLLLLITHLPFRYLLRQAIAPFLLLDTQAYSNTVFYVPIAYFVAIITFLSGTDTQSSLLQMISAMTSGAAMILMCLSIAADNKRLHERYVMERQLSDQQMHYTELKVRVEDARKSKHDFKHHIAAIRHFMEIDDKEGLRTYCDDLTERTEGQGIIPYTGNGAADGVLYHYMQRAQKKNVRFRYSGTIQSRGIADVDLCVLLGNALDNALEGCMTLESGRAITVVSQSEPQLLSVMIHNTFDGQVQKSGDGLLSRKRDNEHGIGQASMNAICQRYGGSMDTKWDANTFTVVFLLPVENEE